MDSRRREQTLNVYAGLSKNFGEKLSADVSLAAEQYHTDIWNGYAEIMKLKKSEMKGRTDDNYNFMLYREGWEVSYASQSEKA